MSGRGNYREIRDRIRNDPTRRLRIQQVKKAMLDGERLAYLREKRLGTQQAFADTASLSQGRVSQIESGEDLYLSTLDRYVRTLGGHLEITAVFPEERVDLTPRADE